MEYVFDYLIFLAKAATVIVALVVIIAAAGARRGHRPPAEGRIQVVRLNDRLRDAAQRGTARGYASRAAQETHP